MGQVESSRWAGLLTPLRRRVLISCLASAIDASIMDESWSKIKVYGLALEHLALVPDQAPMPGHLVLVAVELGCDHPALTSGL